MSVTIPSNSPGTPLPVIGNIPSTQLQKIKDWAIAATAKQQEACGFIQNNLATLEENEHESPEDNFRLVNYIYPKSAINLIWHSHWKDTHSGGLSLSDINVSNRVKLPILVYHSGFDTWDYYEPDNTNPWPLKPINPTLSPKNVSYYENWRFEWGRADCFSVVRRYFLGRLGIEIGEFERPEIAPVNSQSKGAPWNYQSVWNKNNEEFVAMPPGTQPKLHDIFGIALKGGKDANHLAVLAIEPANVILHSVSKGSYSKLDIFDAGWRNLVVPGGHGRHRSLI